MTKQEFADSLHRKNYNCCQSVVCSFVDELGGDYVTAMKAAEGFGLGMGDMNGICGALTGAIMVAGLKNADGNTEAPRSKGSTMQLAVAIRKEFEKRTGALLCRDLKGVDTGKVICTCPDCIRIATEIAEKVVG